MRKEFSFYEFVGILVPSVILLYGLQLIIEFVSQKQIADFSKLGETAIFVVVCYGFGHILQSLGNFFESIVWFIYGGKPSEWLSKKNRFGNFLFVEPFNSKVLDKCKAKFGDGLDDYGRITYNLLFLKEKTQRIDIFNGNYSLFRGLAVSFILIAVVLLYYFGWKSFLLAAIPSLLASIRMIRFGKYYATETFRTFFNVGD